MEIISSQLCEQTKLIVNRRLWHGNPVSKLDETSRADG